MAAALLVSAGGRLAADEATAPPEMASGRVPGYLAKSLDSAALLPRPPAEGSAAQALDSRSTSPIWRCKEPTAGSSPAATPTFLSHMRRTFSPVAQRPGHAFRHAAPL